MGNLPPEAGPILFSCIIIATVVATLYALKPWESHYLSVVEARGLNTVPVPPTVKVTWNDAFPHSIVRNDVIAIFYWSDGDRACIHVPVFAGYEHDTWLEFSHGKLLQNGDSKLQFRRKYAYAIQLLDLVREAAV